MSSRLPRFTALCLAAALLTFDTGCLLSRVVDRAFIGMSVRRPSYADRKTTGVFLLPLTFAIDAATFPIQAILIVILGDNFPFNDVNDGVTTMAVNLHHHQGFDRLGAEERKTALAELDRLMRSGQVTREDSLVLLPDGHWKVVALTGEARDQLIARAQTPPPSEPLACAQ